MSIDIISDDQISDLIAMTKVIMNPGARFVEHCGHLKKNFDVQGDPGYAFTLYLRQNTRPGMSDDFSCGLLWHLPSGDSLTLARYNGPSHKHKNILDKTRVDFACHIHKAREEYIMAGLAPEGHAIITERYKTLEGALHCLVTDCNIANISTESDVSQQELPFT